MPFRRRQILGWSLLAVFFLAAGIWLARLDYPRKISTDVLDLVPAQGQSPELALVRQLASETEARTVLIELRAADGSPAPAAAAEKFAGALAHEPAFAAALPLADQATRDAMAAALFERRLALLFPSWLSERQQAFVRAGGREADFSGWLAHDVASSLEKFLQKPEALAFQEIVPADPLLLMPRVAARLEGGAKLFQPGGDRAAGGALVWAQLAESPLTEAGQAPAFAALDRAGAAARAEFPGLRVADTGVNRFAAASRARIEREVTWLNLLSLGAVLIVALGFIRGAHRSLHLAPVVLGSMIGAWAGTTLAFERVHILVFVIGSLLTGVAVDYGFYLFMQPPATPGEDYWLKVRRLAKPLLASCFTTVAGFALLVFSELPFIRQLGVFVGTGLVCALGAAVVYFSTVRDPFLPARHFRGGQALAPATRKWARRVVVATWIVALPGLARLQWRDDIRELQIPSPELEREDARIRAQFGESGPRGVFLSYGSDLADARASLEQFDAWFARAGGEPEKAISLAPVIPTATQAEAAARFAQGHPEFPAKLRSALGAAGFEENGFEPFFAAYEKNLRHPETLDAAVAAFSTKLAGPAGLLLHAGRPLSWFVTVTATVPAEPPPAELRTLNSSQLQSLNRLFSRYRQSALQLSAIGLAIVGVGVFLTYGGRDGARIFAIPCGACLGLFGLFGWFGHPLNLFHLLGAFLGVCLTHNYSIFSATSAYRGEAPPVSVRMSALTAASSFGVLALSGIPVVRALGGTVALMVVAALLAIEFEHLAKLGSGRARG